jgi:ribosomal protein S27E
MVNMTRVMSTTMQNIDDIDDDDPDQYPVVNRHFAYSRTSPVPKPAKEKRGGFVGFRVSSVVRCPRCNNERSWIKIPLSAKEGQCAKCGAVVVEVPAAPQAAT